MTREQAVERFFELVEEVVNNFDEVAEMVSLMEAAEYEVTDLTDSIKEQIFYFIYNEEKQRYEEIIRDLMEFF